MLNTVATKTTLVNELMIVIVMTALVFISNTSLINKLVHDKTLVIATLTYI